MVEKPWSPTLELLLNYFRKICIGWATLIGLQTTSLEVIGAPHIRPAEVLPIAGLDIKATELQLEKLSELLLQDPQNPQWLLQKGIYLSDSGKLQAAFDIFEALRVAFPDQPAPYVNLASIYARWGQLDEARDMLMKSSALQGDRLQTQLSLASVHMGLALEALTKAREIKPGDPVTQARLQALEKLIADPAGVGVIIKGQAEATEPKKPGKQDIVTTPVPPRRERPKRNQAIQSRGDQLQLDSLDLSADSPALGMGKARESALSLDTARRNDVQTALRSWLKAWSARSFESYASHYSAAFEPSDGTDLHTWKQRRKTLIESTSFIQVDIQILNLQVDGPMASVRVQQTYRSDRYADKVRKDLLLRLEGSQWKLLSERSID